MFGAQSIKLDEANVIVCGGFENMSRIPHYANLRQPNAFGDSQLIDGLLFDGLTDPFGGTIMGVCAEKVIKDFGFTREQLDQICLGSYAKAIEAQKVMRAIKR